MVKAEKVYFIAGRKELCLFCTFKSVHKHVEWGMQVQTPNNSFWKTMKVQDCKTRPASIGGLPPGQNSSWSTLSRVSEPFFCISLLPCFVFHHLVTPNSQVLRCRWSNWRPRAKNLEETQPTESSFTDRGIHDGNILSMHGSMHFFKHIFEWKDLSGFVDLTSLTHWSSGRMIQEFGKRLSKLMADWLRVGWPWDACHSATDVEPRFWCS